MITHLHTKPRKILQKIDYNKISKSEVITITQMPLYFQVSGHTVDIFRDHEHFPKEKFKDANKKIWLRSEVSEWFCRYGKEILKSNPRMGMKYR